MIRLQALSVVFLSLLAVRADAIEMFTNFNNGQNVGFPPMEVPISVYRGIGHGGWNPYAEGMPLKTYPPVPAMMPTGQVPHVWQQPQFSGMPAGNRQEASSVPASYPQRVAIDRRRGRWQRGGYRPTNDGGGTTDSGAEPNVGNPPTPVRPEVESDDSTVDSAPSSRRIPANGEINRPTLLHAEVGTPPVAAPSVESTNSTLNGQDAAPEPPAAIKNSGEVWPQADALFPDGDAG